MMWWLTIPILATQFIMTSGIIAIREKWNWGTFVILATNMIIWLVLVNVLLNDVAENGQR